MSRWTSVVSERLPDAARTRRPPLGERGARAFIAARSDLRKAATANDNAAPLLRRVQRILFAVTAALAVAWLFWAGFLR
jgi:hypothetical protein